MYILISSKVRKKTKNRLGASTVTFTVGISVTIFNNSCTILFATIKVSLIYIDSVR